MRGLFGLLAAGLERKTTDISNYTWSVLSGEPIARSGVAVSTMAALRVSTVLSCARVLAEGVAMLPLKIYRNGADGSKVPATDLAVYRLLYRQPNEWQTAFEMREMMMFHAVLTGNAYAYIGRVGTEIRELIPLLPERVAVRQLPDYELVYQVSGPDGVMATLPRTSVMHLRGPSWNGYAGMNAIQLAREAVGLAIATEESHARLHSNGVKPGGLISVDGKLGKEARDALREQMTQAHGGVSNAYKTMILDQSAKWTPFAMTGVDAQHLDVRKFQIEEICRDLHVFPQMVGHSDKTSTFASAEAFFQAHVTYSLVPWHERWEEVIWRDLLGGDLTLEAKFSVQSLLRGNTATRQAFYAAAIVNGWMTRNEVRLLEELNPLEGLDAPLVPLNMATAAQADGAAQVAADPHNATRPQGT